MTNNSRLQTTDNGCQGYASFRTNHLHADERQRGQHHQGEVGPRLLRAIHTKGLRSSGPHLKFLPFRTVPAAEEGHDVDWTSGRARVRLRGARRAQLLLACRSSATRGVSHLETGQAVHRQGQGINLSLILSP